MTILTDNSIPEASEMVAIHGDPNGTEISVTVIPSIMEWDDEDHPDDWQEGPGEYRIEVAYLPSALIVSVYVWATSRADAIEQARRTVKVEAY